MAKNSTVEPATLYELAQPDYVKPEPLFRVDPLPYTDLVIRAAVVGNSPARLWVDDRDQPRTALLWDTAHCYYLAGQADDPATNAGLAEVISYQIAPVARADGREVFKLYYTAPAWEAAIPAIFAGAEMQPRTRTRFRFTGPPPAWTAPDGFTIQRIDEALLTGDLVPNLPQLLEEIFMCWSSTERFLRAGFGFVARHEGAIAGWCTGEYASGSDIGIGIEVLEPYQRRGLATALAAAFVDHCAQNGLTPHWDAWQSNRPSAATGIKVGFQPAGDYSVYLGRFANGNA